MTETELTRRVVETAAKFLAARPACVREMSVSLRQRTLVEMPTSGYRWIAAITAEAFRRGWKGRETIEGLYGSLEKFTGDRDITITTKFYAPKTNTL
jgi:hypothetical protein